MKIWYFIYILIFNLNINDSLNFYKFGITINRIKTWKLLWLNINININISKKILMLNLVFTYLLRKNIYIILIFLTIFLNRSVMIRNHEDILDAYIWLNF